MKISIIVPVYRVKKYLGPCVESVLVQDYKDYELILVNDRCPDGCGAMCDAYAAKCPDKIKAVHNKQHLGAGGARNAGMRVATGEYILFLDSDDWIDPDMLSLLAKTVNLHQLPDMILFDFRIETKHGGWKVTENLPKNKPICLDSCKRLLFCGVTAWARMVKREIYEKNNLSFTPHVYYEDLYLVPKLLLASEDIVYINQYFYHYRRRPGSIMSSLDINKMKDRLNAVIDIVTYYKTYGAYDKYYDELCFLMIDHLLRSAVLDIMNAATRHKLLGIFREYAESNFPGYQKNKYLHLLSGRYRNQIMKIHNNQLQSLELSHKIFQFSKRVLSRIAPRLITKWSR